MISGESSASTTALAERIVVSPEICGGEPRIAGTRVPVRILTAYREQGSRDEELLRDFPFLTAEDLAAAWAYVAANSNVSAE